MGKNLFTLIDSKTKRCIRDILKVSHNAQYKNVYRKTIEIPQWMFLRPITVHSTRLNLALTTTEEASQN